MDEKYLYAKIQVLVPANERDNALAQMEDVFAGSDIEWDYMQNMSFAYNPTEVYAIYDSDALVAAHIFNDDDTITLNWKRQYTMSVYMASDNRRLQQYRADSLDKVEDMVIGYAMHHGFVLLVPREAVSDDG